MVRTESRAMRVFENASARVGLPENHRSVGPAGGQQSSVSRSFGSSFGSDVVVVVVVSFVVLTKGNAVHGVLVTLERAKELSRERVVDENPFDDARDEPRSFRMQVDRSFTSVTIILLGLNNDALKRNKTKNYRSRIGRSEETKRRLSNDEGIASC